MKAYNLFNLNASYRVTRSTVLTLGVENLFNADYFPCQVAVVHDTRLLLQRQRRFVQHRRGGELLIIRKVIECPRKVCAFRGHFY